MINIINNNSEERNEFLKALREKNSETDTKITQIVSTIIDDVKKRGDEALIEYTKKFDADIDNIEVSRDEINDALTQADTDYVNTLLNMQENIANFHNRQKRESFIDTKDNGVILGQRIKGLDRVAVYVPGGTAAYPSSVLMNVIPAKIAGVKEIIMLTPPMKNGKANPDILVAASISGVDRIFLVGGAQSIAAAAYGTDTIPKVDKIVGPGNIFVATAKKLLFGQVDIDMIAGPSEILIIADEKANAKFVAADLLSQAEHDALAGCILLTTSQKLATDVSAQIETMAKSLSRYEIIEKSISQNGAIILCDSVNTMINMANEIAPEHLEVMLDDPMTYVGRLDNAGSIFLGSYSPEPLGDYYAGPNHVLPTSGTARFFSPLGVDSFIKKTSFIYYTQAALHEAKDDIELIAQKEGLTAHKNSITVRFN